MAVFNIKHWFADGAFRTIIRNSAWLGSSNVVSALLGLLALSCAGKGMTPAMFGVLVIVQSYAKSISDFIKFQTWQLVVQYGTPALTNNNPQQFRNVVSFSFSLDIVSGAVAIVGGIALLPFLSHSLGLDDQSFWLAALYCTLIPSMEKLNKNLKVIGQNTKRLLDLTGQLLDFQKIGASKFELKFHIALHCRHIP